MSVKTSAGNASGAENQQFDFDQRRICGSLNHELQVNDLWSRRIFRRWTKTRVAFKRVDLCGQHVDGACIDRFREERERIARESGASAVDMETEFIARLRGHGIQLLALRVITDTPTQPFLLRQASCLISNGSGLTSPCSPGFSSPIRGACRVWFSSRGVLRVHEKLFECASPDRARSVVSAAAIPRGYSRAGSMCENVGDARVALLNRAFTRCAISWPSCTEMLPSTPT